MYHFILLNHYNLLVKESKKIGNYRIFILQNFPSKNYYITCSGGLIIGKKWFYVRKSVNIINKSESKHYF